MDLKVNIEVELWEMIEKNYQNESYSGAISDAIHLLTETIREKTGLEGDGSNLVGQAFGGDNPKIQLNKLQTESEKNIQKGIQEILKGLYTAIRNPRSHDKQTDAKEDADSIIYFINYLLRIIDKSKLSFEETAFLKRVFDDNYVKSRKYSDLLVKEIPKRQKANIAISVILKRKEGNIYSLAYFLEALFDELEEADINQVYTVISGELKYTSSGHDISTILKLCPGEYWNRVDKAVKIRIEHILLENVKIGKYNSETNKCRFGELGTWITDAHLQNFEDNENWSHIIIEKIKKGDIEEIAYVNKYFWSTICLINRDNISNCLKKYFKTGLINKDIEIVDKIHNEIIFDENHPWRKVFEEELKEYPYTKYEPDLPF
jgi:uncharacterized protein (TIGR02391 family)